MESRAEAACAGRGVGKAAHGAPHSVRRRTPRGRAGRAAEARTPGSARTPARGRSHKLQRGGQRALCLHGPLKRWREGLTAQGARRLIRGHPRKWAAQNGDRKARRRDTTPGPARHGHRFPPRHSPIWLCDLACEHPWSATEASDGPPGGRAGLRSPAGADLRKRASLPFTVIIPVVCGTPTRVTG